MYSGLLSDPVYLLNHIKNRFEGRCLDDSFIIAVRNIQDRSMIVMDKHDLAGGGSMCCVVRAEAIVYPAESIIVGAEVTTIERDGRIICKYDNAIIHLKGDRRFSPNKGDLIPVRIIHTGYPPGSTNMNIAAQPFFIRPSFYMKLFKPDPLSHEELDLIKRKLAEITDARTAYDACDKKLVQFFEDLFYPFKNDYNKGKNKCPFDTKDIIALVNKPDLPKQKPLILSRHAAIHKSSTDVILLDVDTVKNLPVSPWTDKTTLTINVVPTTFGAALLDCLEDYCSYLNFIAQCIEVYSTEQIRKKHQKIWTIYQAIKL
jgi:hypothetical protein